MLDLAPPPLIVPPAIIRPAETRLWAPGYLPVSRDERRAALAALLAEGRIAKRDLANALVVRLPRAEAMLVLGQLAGFWSGRRTPPWEFNVGGYSASSTGTSTRTVAALAYGTAPYASRGVIAGIAILGTASGNNIAISGVTIGTVSATVVSAKEAWVLGAIAYAVVPTGTSGDVVITTSGGTIAGLGVGLISFVGAVSTTASFTATDGTNGNPTLTFPTNGWGFYCTAMQNTSGLSNTTTIHSTPRMHTEQGAEDGWIVMGYREQSGGTSAAGFGGPSGDEAGVAASWQKS